jgi:hypothetical protein
MKDGHVKIYRYLRRDEAWFHANLGGVAFIFEFDNPGDTLSFRFSVCSDEDNFDAKKGIALAETRKPTVIPYDRSKSLCMNVYYYLEDKDANATLEVEGAEKLTVLEAKLFAYFNEYVSEIW